MKNIIIAVFATIISFSLNSHAYVEDGLSVRAGVSLKPFQTNFEDSDDIAEKTNFEAELSLVSDSNFFLNLHAESLKHHFDIIGGTEEQQLTNKKSSSLTILLGYKLELMKNLSLAAMVGVGEFADNFKLKGGKENSFLAGKLDALINLDDNYLLSLNYKRLVPQSEIKFEGQIINEIGLGLYKKFDESFIKEARIGVSLKTLGDIATVLKQSTDPKYENKVLLMRISIII